jgi:putative ATP-dependent endonuclease of OLD family
MAVGEVIEVSVEIDHFAGDSRLVTALADALLPENPLRARLFYRFGPVDTGGEEFATAISPKYRGQVWGGADDDATPISLASRSYIYLHTLGALRDVEYDIRNWRRSPLRRLVESASQKMDDRQRFRCDPSLVQ